MGKNGTALHGWNICLNHGFPFDETLRKWRGELKMKVPSCPRYTIYLFLRKNLKWVLCKRLMYLQFNGQPTAFPL